MLDLSSDSFEILKRDGETGVGVLDELRIQPGGYIQFLVYGAKIAGKFVSQHGKIALVTTDDKPPVEWSCDLSHLIAARKVSKHA